MAQVMLGRLEAEEGELPPVCLVCGAPAVVYKVGSFNFCPDWCYLCLLLTFWPFLVASVLARQRMKVLAPLCAAHRNYWRARRLKRVMVVAVMVLFLFSIYVLLLSLDLPFEFFGTLWIVFWIAGVFWLGLIFISRIYVIYASELTDDRITLDRVSALFVSKLHAEKDGQQ
jgi:hypothetical protein